MPATSIKALDAQHSKHLAERAAVNVDFLKRVTDAKSSESIGQAAELKIRTLTPEIVAGCKALVFFEITKAGVALTIGTGQGMLIKRMHGGRWSAPLLLKVFQMGIGTAVGAASQDCLLVINDESTVGSLLSSSKYKLSADVLLPLGEELKAGAPGSQVFTVTYGSMFLDFSLNGSEVSVDRDEMARTYGPDITPEVLLHTPLEEFAPLYAALNELVAKAAKAAPAAAQ